jgi:hypothetical protein
MAKFHQIAAFVLACSLTGSHLFARPNGLAVECGGCHYGDLGGGMKTPAPNIEAVAVTRAEPGEPVDIAVTVKSAWPDARVAGFLIIADAEAGVFIPSDENTANVGTTEGEPLAHAIGHSLARTLINGTATFNATWTAPTTPGSYRLAVYGVTSDDGDGMDDPDVSEEANDSYAQSVLQIGVGCDLVSYFYDADMDGYGATETLSCEQPAGHTLQGGDCRDDDPKVNPGAAEECSFVDENCDGEAMAPPTFFRDDDGDGYGEASAILVETCTLPEGYAQQAGDCAPEDTAIHPGALEVNNGVDDNCDGVIDEQVAPSPSSCSSSSSSHAVTSAPTTLAETSTGHQTLTSETSSPDALGTSTDTVSAPTRSETNAGQTSCDVALRGRAGAHFPWLLLGCVVLLGRCRSALKWARD